MDVLKFLSKWLHLLGIISMLGGAIFAWLILLPALRKHAIEEEEAAKTIWRGFGISLGVFWLVILLTGFFNVYVVSPTVGKAYHAFLGAKIALALLMLGISMLLVHPSPGFARFQRNRSQWLLVLVVLGVVVVALSTHLNLSRLSGRALERTTVSNP